MKISIFSIVLLLAGCASKSLYDPDKTYSEKQLSDYALRTVMLKCEAVDQGARTRLEARKYLSANKSSSDNMITRFIVDLPDNHPTRNFVFTLEDNYMTNSCGNTYWSLPEE